MKSKFKHSHELCESELEQVYAIHGKVYVSKGVGLVFDIWKNHLLQKRYHGVSDKLIQLFYLNDLNRVDAYNILTQPIKIGDDLWSKNIEVGSFTLSRRDVEPAFLMLYEELMAYLNNIILFVEASMLYPRVINYLKKSKFVLFYDVSKLNAVFRTFIQSDEFELYNGGQGVEIKRKTFFDPEYHGYVLVNDYKQTNK
jgi:hypothetical protein